jgi:hypothetical protein
MKQPGRVRLAGHVACRGDEKCIYNSGGKPERKMQLGRLKGG